jgi:hypothetical protein
MVQVSPSRKCIKPLKSMTYERLIESQLGRDLLFINLLLGGMSKCLDVFLELIEQVIAKLPLMIDM